MIDFQGVEVGAGVSCLLVNCSARKTKLSLAPPRCRDLRNGTQSQVAQAWLAATGQPDLELMPAQELYLGAGLQRVWRTARHLGKPMWVVSAGLGLVRADQPVPSYDLTLSEQASDAIQARVEGEFDPAMWWQQIQRGRFAHPVSTMGTDQQDRGRVLIALTKPYAKMTGPSLAALPPARIAQLRLFGGGIDRALPKILHSQVMRYDDRLDQLVPGIKLDGAARALEHFVSLIVRREEGTAAQDQALIDAALGKVTRATSIRREPIGDDELNALMVPWRAHGLSFSQALRRLRDVELRSSEEGRFRRIYLQVKP
jgi:hypothetical protein